MKNISRPTQIIAVILVVLIATFYFTDPKHKQKKMTVAAPNQMEDGMRQSGMSPDDLADAGMTAAPERQNAAAPVAKSNLAQTMFAGVSENFELLQERYGRDNPFAPFYVIKEKIDQQTQVFDVDLPELTPVVPQVLYTPPAFVLTAIATKDGRGIAVINGEILKEGDRIEGFQVVSILKDQVQLKGQMGDVLYLKIKQELKGDYGVKNNEISNINVGKPSPVNQQTGNKKSSAEKYLSPVQLSPLPDYSIPEPDDIQFEKVPSYNQR